jgi:hypothetical protein
MRELGIIITNRDRPQPLYHCLQSLAAQVLPPAWVVIADLGSSPEEAAELQALADTFCISYLRIAHDGQWNQALAFNTALVGMPPVTHVIQLDADMILHPYLLSFTDRGLQSVEALCCVPSYVSAHLVPKDYDGSWRNFRRVLSVAYGGHRLSRGGYVVVPRHWLIANGAYDEAYRGWGFEDADLWWRVGQQLTTYVEESGSLLLHQSHTRQAGATALDTNPNWRRYQLREAGVSLPVNPSGFGHASIDEATIRFGIRSPGSSLRCVRIEEELGLHGVRVRTRLQDRLRPVEKEPGSVALYTGSLPNGGLMSRHQHMTSGGSSADAVSVVVLLHHSPPHLLTVSLDSLLAQSLPPNQIILSDYGNSPDLTQNYLECARQRPECDYVLIRNDRHSPGQALNEALRFVHSATRLVLAISEGVLPHPRMLELLSSLQHRGPCFVHGRTHTAPPMACELSTIDGLPWEAWGSVAHLEVRDLGWWHFGPLDWIQGNAIYDETLSSEDFNKQTVRLVQRSRTISLVQMPDDLVLCYACPRRQEIPGETV